MRVFYALMRFDDGPSSEQPLKDRYVSLRCYSGSVCGFQELAPFLEKGSRACPSIFRMAFVLKLVTTETAQCCKCPLGWYHDLLLDPT